MKEENLKLYKITLSGCTEYNGTYIISDSMDSAARFIETYLEERGLCFSSERKVISIDLVAMENSLHFLSEISLLLINKTKE